MAGRIFMDVGEVAAEMGVSVPYAYKLIRQLNEEMKTKGCVTVRGKVDRKYFYEQFYGTRENSTESERRA